MSTVYVDLIYVPEPAARKLIPGRSRWQPWRFAAKSANGKVIARSSERYTNAGDARRAVELLFGAATTVVLREPERPGVTLRVAQ